MVQILKRFYIHNNNNPSHSRALRHHHLERLNSTRLLITMWVWRMTLCVNRSL